MDHAKDTAAPTTPTGNPTLDTLVAEVTQAETVMTSAATLIGGIQGRIDSAVAQALANGATAAQLAPVSAVSAQLATSVSQLSAAVTANTPAVPPAGS